MARAAAVVVEEPSEYEAAKRRWDTFAAKREAAQAQVQGYEAALLLADHRTARPDAPMEAGVLAQRAARVLQGRPVSVRQLGKRLEDAQEAAEAIQLEVAAEAEAWQAARRAEHGRVALGLQPKHRAAVKQLAAAVEALSAAITAERAVRDEMQASGLAANGSGYLPDCSSQLGTGTLDEWSSRASAWNRDMLRLGVLR